MKWERGISGTFLDLRGWAMRGLVCQVVGYGRGRGVAELMKDHSSAHGEVYFPVMDQTTR